MNPSRNPRFRDRGNYRIFHSPPRNTRQCAEYYILHVVNARLYRLRRAHDKLPMVVHSMPPKRRAGESPSRRIKKCSPQNQELFSAESRPFLCRFLGGLLNTVSPTWSKSVISKDVISHAAYHCCLNKNKLWNILFEGSETFILHCTVVSPLP